MSARTERRLFAGIAAALGLLAAVTGGSPRASSERGDGATRKVAGLVSEIEREAGHVSARQLAEWIRAGKPDLRVLDVRTDSAFAAYHIPSAEPMRMKEVAALTPPPSQTLVLYSEADSEAAQARALLRARGHEHVYVLHGGLLDWVTDVMSPVVAGDSAARIAALSRYFGGVPRAATDSARAEPVVDDLVRRGC